MATIACIIVRTARAFNRLGGKNILLQAIERVDAVRSVEKIIVLAAKALVSRTKSVLQECDPDSSIPVMVVPDKLLKTADALAIEHWVCETPAIAAAMDYVLIVTPTTPFLPSGKLEQCLTYLRRQAADHACTAAESRAMTPVGRQTVYAEQPGCRAFVPARWASGSSKFKPVPVTKLEALDVANPDESRIATALAAGGIA